MTFTRKLLIAGLILVFPVSIGTVFIPREPFYMGIPFEAVPLILGILCLFAALIIWIATGSKRKEK